MDDPYEAFGRTLNVQSSRLLAQRTAIDALVATHPDPEAFLRAHKANVEKLDRLSEDGTAALEAALAMHEMYRRHFEA